MSLAALALKKETLSLGPMEQVTIRLPVALFDLADELAEAFDTTRSDALREMTLAGYRQLMAEWDQALKNGEKSK